MCIRDSDNIISCIEIIYKSCIALQFTPTSWKEAKVIFIPKNGKDRYDKAKSFRPISLSNYLLKGLEKLCVWKVEEDLLKSPIHKNQHGFQKGKSTETAISKTVNLIEKHMNNGKKCIGVFLDIQGAFDTIDPKYITQELQKHSNESDLICLLYTSPSPRD